MKMEGNDLKILVAEAFDSSKPSRFDQFVAKLSSAETSDADVLGIFDAILNSHLHEMKEMKRQKAFVEALLKVKWAMRDFEVVKVYANLLCVVLVSNLWAAKDTLKSIILNFLIPRVDADSDDLALVVSRRAKYDLLFNKVHHCLETVLHKIPGSSHYLVDLLEKTVPYKKAPTFVQECYFYNLLRMCDYVRELRSRILQIIIQHLVALDVLAPRLDIIESDFGDVASLSERLETFESQDTDADSSGFCLMSYRHFYSRRMNHPIAHTLDVLMLLLFDWISRKWRLNKGADRGTKLRKEGFNNFWRELLAVFQKSLLTTEKTSHVQFVMFFVCNLDRAMADAFLDYLWKRVADPGQPAVVRRASACFVASFIARAKHCRVSSVNAIFFNMLNWTERYCDRADSVNSKSRDEGNNRHSIFYVVCQSLFYMLAFRHEEILKNTTSFRLYGLKLKRIVDSSLNPLHFCLEAVVSNFASICSSYQLIDCHPIINENRRNKVPRFNDDERIDDGDERGNPLGVFFPFDPYLLSQSAAFIVANNSYQEFEAIDQSMEKSGRADGDAMDVESAIEVSHNTSKAPYLPSLEEEICATADDDWLIHDSLNEMILEI